MQKNAISQRQFTYINMLLFLTKSKVNVGLLRWCSFPAKADFKLWTDMVTLYVIEGWYPGRNWQKAMSEHLIHIPDATYYWRTRSNMIAWTVYQYVYIHVILWLYIYNIQTILCLNIYIMYIYRRYYYIYAYVYIYIWI